jgi:2-polyprenyl-6-methoxyphenol hydroxylase-like FAD-dependent oxidoreductase
VTKSQPLPILIAGGGIGGLTAALALSRHGFRVCLLEQAREFKEIGAGIQLGPNAFKVFDRLGITDQISSTAVFPESLLVMDSITAEEVTRIPLGEKFLGRFRYPYALIHRADIHSVLLQACRSSPLIALVTSQKVARFDDRGDQIVVHTEDGTSFEGAALIGADGLWSTIRATVVGDGPPRVSGHIAYRAVLATEEVPLHLRIPSMTLWAGPRNHLVHYPLRGGELFNLVAVFHSDRYREGWDSAGDPDELKKRFQDVVPDVQTMLGKIESWRMWVLCDREPVKNWSHGRVTLLGDAAHPMLQYLAQGACMAIEDAVVLAEEMDRAAGDHAKAFEAYQERRYLRTGRVQLTARLYGEFFHASGASREIRNQFLRERTAEAARESVGWLYDGI